MNMDRSEQITEIISKRQTYADQIKKDKPHWIFLKEILEKLEQYRLQYSGNPELSKWLKDIDFSTYIPQINRELEILGNLETRLSRSTLNIGVVGRMRQGKSRLLQSLTGLTQAEIPTSDQGVCTRGLSKIFHTHDPSQAKILVEFHSWHSFIEVIHLYFDKLDLTGSKPSTPDEFSQRPPVLPEHKNDENSRFLYGRLCKEYYSQFQNYQSLLTGDVTEVSQQDITKYIAQDQSSKSEYLAVKEVRILCEFPHHQEVGRIGVIDLPGLGDDNIFDVERLIKALQEEIDLILFVRRPDPLGDDWQEADRAMFKTAREALGDFPVSNCAFMVLNRVQQGDTDSLEACDRFAKTATQHHIEVRQCVIANCADAGDVRTQVLMPVLDDLTSSINVVYDQYLRSHKNRLNKLQIEISKKLKQSKNSLIQGQDGDLGFDEWFDGELWPNLTNGLQELLRKLRANRNESNSDFENEVIEAVKSCRAEEVIPSIEKIEERRDEEGDSYKIAYYIYIKEIRETLSSYFKSPLGEAIGRLLKDLQHSVIDVLKDKGSLAGLTDKVGADFFQEIIAILPDRADRLKQGFNDIQNVRYSYDDIIMNWIKHHLEQLAPDNNLDPISQKQIHGSLNQVKPDDSSVRDNLSKIVGIPITQEQMQRISATLVVKPVENSSQAESIHNSLDSLRYQVVNECEITLNKKLSEPNELALTLVQDFVDRVLSAKGVQTEWRTFLRKEIQHVWPEARQQQGYIEIRQTWGELINRAIVAIEGGVDIQPELNPPVSVSQPISGHSPTILSVQPQPYIKLKNPADQTCILYIQNERHQIGRDPNWSDIEIPDAVWEVLSRHHAVLQQEGDSYRIYDGDGTQPSSNGIFVNETRITPQQGYLLKNGDQLTIGNQPHNQVLLTYCNPNN
jgi:hypothetical protein